MLQVTINSLYYEALSVNIQQRLMAAECRYLGIIAPRNFQSSLLHGSKKNKKVSINCGINTAAAYELQGEGLVWLIGAVVCLCAAPRVQLFASAGNMDSRIMRRGIISSCRSTATSEIVKRLRRVNSAIANTRPLALSPFYSDTNQLNSTQRELS